MHTGDRRHRTYSEGEMAEGGSHRKTRQRKMDHKYVYHRPKESLEGHQTGLCEQH